MSTVDKLLIQGVRSFGPHNQNIIEFYKPLTIIVGENGAGKTTTIECLKYACTGSFPPNTKSGQAFVHDPKVAGEREIKAKIQLKFTGANSKPIVITRNLQLTQKPSKLEFKTLDSALQTTNEKGEKVSHDYRCADMDKEVPELMGVNRHILEDVVFCHQEDSNWPLGDSTTLKKKFDDIFAATRYTKAIKQIKEQRKEYTQKIREMKLELITLQTHQETAERLKKEKENFEKQLETDKEEIIRLNNEIIFQKEKLEKLKQQGEVLRKQTEEVTLLKTKKRTLAVTHQKTTQQIKTEYKQSTSELQTFLTNFDKIVKELQEKSQTYSKKLEELKPKKEMGESKVREYEVQERNFYDKKKHGEGLLNERNEKISSLTERYCIPSEFQNIDLTSDMTSLKKYCQGLADKFKIGLTQIKKEKEDQSQKYSERLEELKKQKNTTEDRKIRDAQQIESLNVKISKLLNKIPTTNSFDSRFQTTKEELELEEQELNHNNLSDSHQKFQNELEKVRLEKAKYENIFLELSETMKLLNQEASARVKLDILRDNIKKEEEELLKLLKLTKEIVNEKSNNDFDFLKNLLLSQLKEKNEEFKNLKKKLSEKEKFVSSQSGQLKSVQEQIEKKKNIEQKKNNISSVIGKDNPNFESHIHKIQEKIQRYEKDISFSKAGEVLYQQFISSSTNDQICPLCDRPFDNENHLENFQKDLKQKYKEFPETRKMSENKLEEVKKIMEHLKPLEKDNDSIIQLKPEILELEEKYSEAKQENDILEKEIKEEKNFFENFEKKLEELKKGTSIITEAEKLAKEIEKLKNDLSIEQKKLAKVSKDTRSLEHVSNEYENTQKIISQLNQKMDDLRNENQKQNDEFRIKQQNFHKRKEEFLHMEFLTQETQRIQKEISEIEEEKKRIQQESEKYSNSLNQLESEIEEISKKLSDINSEARQKEEGLTKDKEHFQTRFNQISNLGKQLDSLSFNEIEEELEKVAEKKKIAQKDLLKLNEYASKYEEELFKIRKENSESELKKSDVEKNLQWRDEHEELSKIDEHIKQLQEELKKKIGDTKQYEEEMRITALAIEKANEKFYNFKGSEKTIQEQIKDRVKQLSKTNYKNIDQDVKKMKIELETMELTNEDLDKYSKALDKALMKFHSLKMTEINKIIKELWRATYRSSDIDTIEIKSEEAKQNEKRKSYNYRIVMVKGETELDMRGRCSAGQKVLACLLIRLALAETFCLNCGILALDEPTTNLDRNNVESFANALVQIIESRRKQRNFQLIIITHDEEFVSLLGRSDHADYYWRVTKDPKGTSKIERCDISELG